VKHYLRCARTFLTGLSGPLEEALPGLPAGQVIDFVRDWSTRRSSTALDMVTLPALRSLLRFLHLADDSGQYFSTSLTLVQRMTLTLKHPY
jgi:hypothetical protein